MATKIPTPLYASRSLGLRAGADGTPVTVDEANRSVEVIASTEDPAMVWDWDKWRAVPEVLLMSGVRLPQNGQTPLLDTHSRQTVNNVLGSFRDIKSDSGSSGRELTGRMYFASSAPDAERAWQLVRQGHVTDVSVGYEINAHVWVEDGQTTTIEGRSFTGPLRVVTDWSLFELSLCPIGADSNAKIRQLLAGLTPAPAQAAGPNMEINAMAKKSGGKTAKKTQRELEQDLANNVVPGEEGEMLDPVDDPEYVEPEEERADAGTDEIEDEKDTEIQRKKGARGINPDAAQRIRQAERSRVAEITAACRDFNISDDMRDSLIARGVSEASAKIQIMEIVRRTGAGAGQPMGGFSRVEVGRGAGEKFRAAASGALMLRAGINLSAEELKNYAGHDGLRGYTLKELARECLRAAGHATDGSALAMVGRALTTTDLPLLLVATQRRVLLDSYQAAKETWPIWMGEGTATDFKETFGVNLDADLDLKLKREDDEYRYARLGENAEKFRVRTYGRKLVITREAIINDDLDALSRIPRLAGEAAAKSVGDIAYDSFLSNPVMMDGNALFSAAHGNIYAGAGGAPTIETLGRAVTGMMTQTTPLGKPIGTDPVYFIAPVNLMVSSETFFSTNLNGSPIVSSSGAPVQANLFGGAYFTRVYDRRIDAATPNTWYLAGPKGTSVLVYFLNGEKEPYMESDVEFNTDNVAIKVRLDVGAAPMSYTSIAQATPAPDPAP